MSDKFIQPADSVVVESRKKGTLLDDETLAAGRARIVAGEDPAVVALDLAKYEIELMEEWSGLPPTLVTAEFDESKIVRDDRGRFSPGGTAEKFGKEEQPGRVLNGVPLVADMAPDFSKSVNHTIDEPAFPALPAGKTASAGVVMVEPDGRVWVYEPEGKYGGYKTTFSKGGIEQGEHPQTAAVREAWEETGLVPQITGHLIDVERTTTVTRFYVGKRIGGAPWAAGKEAHAVKLLDVHGQSIEHALKNTFGGRTTDHRVLAKLREHVSPRALASRDNNAVHRAADANYKQMMLVVSAAFMRGRKAYKAGGTDAAVKAIRKALVETLPAVLLKTAAASGTAALAALPKRLRAAGDLPGHEFHGNQWTAGVDALPRLPGYPGIDAGKVFPGGIVYRFPDDGQTQRPYDGNQLAAALKKQKPELTEVSSTSLIATQDILDRKPLLFHLNNASQQGQGKRDIIVASFKGKQYIADGHHRVAAALLRGDKSVKVRVVKMDHAPTIKALQEFRSTASLRTLKPQKSGQPHDVAGPYGLAFNVTDPNAIAWAEEHAAELAEGISETSRDRIKDAVARALDGDGIDAAYDDILEAVGSEARADVIARTEVMDAANEGLAQGWAQAQEAGLLSEDAQKEWIATSGCCDDCDELDGERVGLDEDFSGGDDPPLHPNCRCTMGIAGAEE